MQLTYYIISTICLLVISATMLARANDLRWKAGLHWNTRLIGFIVSGFAPWGVIIFERTPGFYETLTRFGLMLVFITTPYLPPWWKWISGQDGSDPKFSDDRRMKP